MITIPAKYPKQLVPNRFIPKSLYDIGLNVLIFCMFPNGDAKEQRPKTTKNTSKDKYLFFISLDNTVMSRT